jgi:hypothetical protein
MRGVAVGERQSGSAAAVPRGRESAEERGTWKGERGEQQKTFVIGQHSELSLCRGASLLADAAAYLAPAPASRHPHFPDTRTPLLRFISPLCRPARPLSRYT